jgi:uncharacterized protein (DUF1499 family)
MVDTRIALVRGRHWPLWGVYLGFGVATIALIVLTAGPLGWRFGLWHFRFAFFYLMPFTAYAGLAAGIVSLIALAFGWSGFGARTLTLAGIGVIVGAVMAYVPWQYYHTLNTVPRIHDITTDTDNPPAFVAAPPLRAADHAENSVDYEGPALAQLQKTGYPDLAPLVVALPPTEAFEKALETAKSMSGWTVIESDPKTGRIEANQSTTWFRFVDDVVIRVTADGTGSRIDMRSVSRVGKSDFGVNARRIRAFMTALKAKIG